MRLVPHPSARHPPLSERQWIASLTEEQVSEMSRDELFEVIFAYQSPGARGPGKDHRRFLSRSELEHLVHLASRQCRVANRLAGEK